MLERIYESGTYHVERSNAESSAWSERAAEVLRRLPEGTRSVLDFGAGEGHLVAALRRRGLRAEGVEPAAAGRRAALDAHGIKLHQSLDFLPGDFFDAIVLLHSIEHVIDPRAALAALHDRLGPSGAMLVEVPHAASADMMIPRQRRAILDLPVHLHHFTPKTLGRVAAAAGLATKSIVLFNVTPVELVLARLAQSRIAQDPPRENRATPGQEPTPRAGQADTDAGAARVLAALRHVLPGPKFQWIGHAGYRRR